MQGIQAQARIRQALEGLAQVGLDRQVGKEPFLRQFAPLAILDPELQQFPVGFDLVEELRRRPSSRTLVMPSSRKS